MPVNSRPDPYLKSRRKQSHLRASLCAALLSILALVAPLQAYASYSQLEAEGTAVRPYVYATPGDPTTYDIMLADGASNDRRVASIKVDGVAFGDASARLSSDGTFAAVRVTGDRYGGSSLHIVDVKNGKTVQVASAKDSSAGIGAYKWSPAGNTLAFVRSAPALDPAAMEDAYGEIFIVSVGFEAVRLSGAGSKELLLSFSGDGLGVYLSRREQVGAHTVENLVYTSMKGGGPVVLLRSRPDLRYFGFAVYSPPGVPAKIAALAEGKLVIPVPPVPAVPAVPASTEATSVFRILSTSDVSLSRPRTLGLIVSDPAGTWPTLIRQDSESYPYMTWSGNGDSLLMGGSRNGSSWLVDMAGNKRPVGTSLFGLRAESWSPDGATAVLSDNPATRLVTLNLASGSTLATRNVGAEPKPGAAAVKLAVPYVHQVNDTASRGDGNWACGPTSIVMALAYYGKIDPWPLYEARQALSETITLQTIRDALTLSKSSLGTAAGDYAPYITEPFTLNGRSYGAFASDPRGKQIAGLYGTISPNGMAEWQTMVSVLNSNGLSSQYVSVTWEGVTGALKRGSPVLLGNQLTAAGHILVVIGYTPDGNLIVNDPYGNAFAPGYGSNNGRGLYYPWKRATARRALEVTGVYPPPPRPMIRIVTPTSTATPQYSPTPLPGILTPTAAPAQASMEPVSPTPQPPTPTTTPITTQTPTFTPSPTYTHTPQPPTETPAPTLTPTLTPTPNPARPTTTPEPEASPTPSL